MINLRTVADNRQLQEAALEQLRRVQEEDPFRAVTLLVPTSSQGWVLRRQLVAALPEGSGFANIRIMTLHELVRTAKQVVTGESHTLDPLAQAVAIERLLAEYPGPLASTAGNKDSTQRLMTLAEELSWSALTPERLKQFASVSSMTSTEVVSFVAHLRSALPDFLSVNDWSSLETSSAAERLAQLLGSVIVIEQRLPSTVRALLESLAAHGDAPYWIHVKPQELKRESCLLNSSPDPTTEVRLALDFVVESLMNGVKPHEIALLYSKDQPYAGLIDSHLESAAINWHGPTADSLGTLTLPRIAMLFASMAAQRTSSASGIRRIDLMHWFAIGAMTIDGERANIGALRNFIQSESLFGDARSWIAFLDSYEETVGPKAAQEDERSKSRARSIKTAHDLRSLISRLDQHLETIKNAPTWAATGNALFAAIEEFHLDPRWMNEDQDERSALTIVRNLLTQTLPRIDEVEVEADTRPSDQLPNLLERQFIGRRTKHGNLSQGIHVGSASSARGLHFKAVAIVGALEGFLPVSLGDDPLLSDQGRLALRQNADDLPISSEVYVTLEETLWSILNAADSSFLTYPRAGLESVAEGKPSRYFADLEVHECLSNLDATLNRAPISTREDALHKTLRQGPEAELVGQITAGQAWHQVVSGEYFGAAGPGTLNELTLSASAIEAFLHCPHQFFVSRDLRISTDQYQDDVDIISASDFGTLLHSVFEEFVVQASPEELPDFGTDWPADASRRLLAILDRHVESAKAKGTVGWLPAWNRQYDMVVESLPLFFAADLMARSAHELKPLKAEQEFGMNGDKSVALKIDDETTIYLRGYIDRLDISKDGKTVGVIDYKSGNATFFEKSMAATEIKDRDKVQDLIYDLAARTLYPETEAVDVNFFFFPNGGEPKLVAGQQIDREAVLREILEEMQATAKTGTYEPRPKSGRDFCPVCKLLGRRATRRGISEDEEEEVVDDE